MVRLLFLLLILSCPLICMGENTHDLMISKSDIQSSMATSLNELLEIYAPDYLYLVDSKHNTRVISRGFVSENQQIGLYINDIPTSMTQTNGSQWGFELPYIDLIDSIKIKVSDNPLLPPSSKAFGSIFIYLNKKSMITLTGETGFSRSNQQGIGASASYSLQSNHAQHQIFGSYQRRRGLYNNRLFGSAAKNKLDPTTYIFPVGDTGAIVSSTTPFRTDGDAILGYTFSRNRLQLQTLATRTEHYPGAFKILNEHQSSEERMQILNQATHIQPIGNSTLITQLGYNLFNRNYFADSSKSSVEQSNEHTLLLSSYLSLPQGHRIHFSTGIQGLISLMDDSSSYQDKSATLWTGIQFAAQKQIKPGLHLSATKSNTSSLSLQSQLTIEANIHAKHSLLYSMSSKSLPPTGSKNNNTAMGNPNNPYPGKWSYTNGHLYDSLFVDSLAGNEYLLGKIVPPESKESPLEKYFTLSLQSSHNLSRMLNLQTETSLQQIKGYLFYNSRDKIYKSGPEVSTLSASIGLKGKVHKWHYSIVNTYSRLLKQKVTTTALNTPEATPLWDSAFQVWIPSEVDTSSLIYEDMANYLFAEDSVHLNNVPTLVTKLNCRYAISERIRITANSRIFWGLIGRKGHHERSMALNPEDNHLQMDSKPIIKVNAAARIALPKRFYLNFGIRNILGSENNRHAVRWTELHAESESPYYTLDRRTVALHLEKEI